VINLQPNQTADLIFQENKGNGGDYTDEVVNVSVWRTKNILAPRESFFNTTLKAFWNPRPSLGFSFL
jgi:hypothetical protein